MLIFLNNWRSITHNWTAVVHHDAVTHTVHHDLEVGSTNYPEVSHVVHHPASIHTVVVDGYMDVEYVFGEWIDYWNDGYWVDDYYSESYYYVEGYWSTEWSPGYFQDVWVDGYEYTVTDQEAWDETVVDSPEHTDYFLISIAYDETVEDRAAYDEPVVTPAYEEFVTTPAYDESITTPAYDTSVTTPAYDTPVTTPAYDEIVPVPAYDTEVLITAEHDEPYVITEGHNQTTTTPGWTETVVLSVGYFKTWTISPSLTVGIPKFAVVSKGTDPDLATDVRISLSGTNPGVPVNAKVNLTMGNSDGSVKFDKNNFNISFGQTVTVKVWGVTPSSGLDKSLIEAEFEFDQDSDFVTTNLTIIEGVKFEFDGTFYSPVDVRNWGRRPGDGSDWVIGSLPKNIGQRTAPNGNIFAPGVLAQDTGDFRSRIVFWDGDQGVVRRTWAPSPSVTVKKVFAQKPAIQLTGDILENSEIHMISGAFFEDDGSGDIVKKVRLGFRQPGQADTILGLAPVTDSRLTNTDTTGSRPGRSSSSILVDLQAAATSTNRDVLIYWSLNAVGDSTLSGSSFSNMVTWYQRISTWTANWKNNTISASKEVGFASSLGAKALLGWQEKHGSGKIEASLGFSNFYEWELAGTVENGSIQTP
jgi:hypothetical protein